QVTNDAPATFPLGSTTVTWTVTDDSNNTATATQTVTVTDNEDPTITAPSNVSVNSDNGACSASGVTLGNPTTNDNCGIQQVTNDAPATFPLGSTTVTWTVTDDSNNTATATQTVTVTDNEDPAITAPSNVSVNSDNGACSASGVTLGNPTTNDNCGVKQVTNDAPATFPLGSTTVTWTVTDDSNNTATATQTVTVTDNEKPIILADSDITVNNDAGACGAMVTINPATASDNCQVGTPSGVRSDGKALNAEYPVGLTTVITWTVTDANGNAAEPVEQNVTVLDNEAPVVPNIENVLWGCEKTISKPVATDNCIGDITGTTSDPLTYSSEGTYQITWSFDDGNGNISTAQQTVTIDPVQAEAQTTDILCNGAATGEISITASGGAPPYTYEWQGSTETGNSRSGLTAGTYTVTVKDANNCATDLDIILTEPEPLIMTAPEVEPVSCFGNADGSVSAGTVSGGVGTYKYKITGRNYQASTDFSNLAPGDYVFTVQDENNCTYETGFTIDEPTELSMTAPSSTNVTCFGGSDGTITAGTVTGGNGDYLYSINNIDFSPATTFEGLSAGSHTIFVQDSKGCALQKIVNISEPDKLNADIIKTNVSCFDGNDGKLSISNPSGGSGSYQFSLDQTTWYNSSEEITGLTAGSYTLYIKDAVNTNCIVILEENFEITQPSAPLEVEISTTRTTSYGSASGTATANPTGGTPGYTYEWRKAGETEVFAATKTATNLLAGDYEVTVTDNNGCTFTDTFTIIDAIEAFIASRSVCEDEGDQNAIRTSYFEVKDLTAVGGVAPYTYEWDFGSGATDPVRSGTGEHRVYYGSTGNKTVTLTITDDTGETFKVTQQNYVGNCYEPCGKSENFVFNPDNIYIGNANGDPLSITDQVLCDNSVAKYIYISIDKSANAYNPYIELIYKISNTNTPGDTKVSYAGGCRSGDDINDDPNDSKENKIGGFIRLTLDPIDFECGDNLDVENFYVTWTNVEHKKCGQNNNAFCYSQDEPVILPTPLSAVATPTHILCKGDSTGSISVSVSGGYAPYSFNLTGEGDPYDNSNKFNNLKAGEHTVYVRDSRGNTTSVTTTIEEPSTNIIASTTVENPECFGSLGEASVTAEGGTPFEDGTYEYLWNDPSQQTTATASGLAAGEYTVTVIDANGCQTLKTVTVTEPEELTLAQTGENQSFGCGVTSTTLTGNTPDLGKGTWEITSGTDGIIDEPNNPTSAFTGNAGQTYVLTWTIANEDGTCPSSENLEISFNSACSFLDFDGIDDYVDFGDNYGLDGGSFSLEAWVKLKSLTGVKTVLSKRNTNNLVAGGFDLIVNSGAPTFRWGSNSVSTSSKINTDRWYHLAVIYESSKIQLYVDGLLVGSSSATNPSIIASPFLIGAMYNSETPEKPKNHFHGWIEEVRIWDKALSEEQLRFMMNQRLETNGGAAKGTVLPLNVPGDLSWNRLRGYYRLMANETVNGYTLDLSTVKTNKIDGKLRNIETSQENTAPLPYFSVNDSPWGTDNTWAKPNVWDPPNSNGINGKPINWNIARISNNISSGSRDIHLLGLISESGLLTMATEGETKNENNSGQGLTITHYLKLNGNIDLVGESQLVQTEGSILDESSSGYLERDQQGTENSFNYNYWTSPVSPQGSSNNSGYTIAGILKDGTSSSSPRPISFGYPFYYADGSYSGDKHISTYWLYTFHGTADTYGEWHYIGASKHLDAGEGFTMKGTSGSASISSRQNYVFKGKPNNGIIKLSISNNENRLVGNPYPSALDAEQFIRDNLKDVEGGTNSQNVFNGAIYLWDHFGQENSHVLREYVGGYATYNLSGGVPAASTDARINANGSKGSKVPRRYIPVAQGFFVNTLLDESVSGNYNISGGDIIFNNGQRAFVREQSGSSQFLTQAKTSLTNDQRTSFAQDTRYKIRLAFHSPAGYHRQILVTADSKTTNGFDLGYDAPLIDDNKEDMYWLINNSEFVIQAVPNFNLDQKLPLGIKISEEGKFEIEIDELENLPDHMDIYLKDNSDTTYYNLRKKAYKTDITPGTFNDRYELVFTKQIKEVQELPREIEFNIRYSRKDMEFILGNPNLLAVDKVMIYNLNGQTVDSFKEQPVEKFISLKREKQLSAGVYIVKVFSGTQWFSKKVIIGK
ncbi:LamG-like jellyroll fold domain-containing protein, partial [Salegentibacter chungangensis]